MAQTLKLSWLKAAFETVLTWLGKSSERTKVVSTVVKVLTLIQNISISPEVDVITALIPGGTDDKIVALLRQWLPIIITSIGGLPSPTINNEKLVLSINRIQNSGIISGLSLSDIKLQAVGVGLTQAMLNCTQSEAMFANETYYKAVYKQSA